MAGQASEAMIPSHALQAFFPLPPFCGRVRLRPLSLPAHRVVDREPSEVAVIGASTSVGRLREAEHDGSRTKDEPPLTRADRSVPSAVLDHLSGMLHQPDADAYAP